MKRPSSKVEDTLATDHAGVPGGQRILAAYDRVLSGLGLISALSLLVVPVLVSVDVVTRHTGIGNIIWVADVCEYLLFASTMIGAPWLLRLGRHVRIDILPNLLPEFASRMLELGVNLLMLAVCLLLFIYGTEALWDAVKYNATLYKALQMPVWPLIAIYLFAFGLICLELFVRLLTGRGGTEDEKISL